MSSRTLLATGLILLACCCCCANRDEQTDPPVSAPQDVVAFANAPATEVARIGATAYTEGLLEALRDEVPSLVLLDTGVEDWCDPGACRLGTDYFFGLDSDLLASLARIDAVFRRDGAAVLTGIESVRDDQTSCAELRFEIRPYVSERTRPWTATVLGSDPADTACPARLRPVVPARSGSVYRVREENVDVDGLLAGMVGRHRFVVRVRVDGSYIARR